MAEPESDSTVREKEARRDARFDFDVLFIGGGQATVPLAPKLCKEGFHVAVAERAHMGGSCVNFGCLPSKAVHASARLAHLARRGADFGIEVGGVRPNLREVLARARALINEAETHITRDFERGGVELLCVHARLAGRTDDGKGFTVLLDDNGTISSVTARRVVLNTGARTAILPIEGLAEADPITAENWPTREVLPSRLAVMGGGYIGVEMGQFYQRMGSRVTLIESGGQILSREDPDVVGCLQTCLAADGMRHEGDGRAANGWGVAP
jgi:pyruvate/2-oxoglutarate dehydrogenase complex dihydrolipoamide dehydrogenase (E3) component